MKWKANFILMKKSKFKLKINQFAQEDIEKAKEYYDEKRIGLGREYWIEVKNKLEDIEKNPLQFQIIQDETRRANLKRFPFGIFFIVKDPFINVFGVIHFSRSPLLWIKRSENPDLK
jgi:toxin ParE1/3/4